jgi:hypothetical protein
MRSTAASMCRSAAGSWRPSYAASSPPRFLSRAVPEPPPGVLDEDNVVDPRDVFIPYVPESMRAEMYAKFKLNPSDATFFQLAREYSMGLTRCKAIVFLMRKREEAMRTSGVLSVPPQWTAIFNSFKESEQRGVAIAELKKQISAKKEAEEVRKKKFEKKNKPVPEDPAAADNSLEEQVKQLEEQIVWTKEALAAEHKLPVEEISTILARMNEHDVRSTNLRSGLEHIEEQMQQLRESGVDTTFRETGSETNANFDSTYFPRLLNDDELDEEARRLRIDLLMKTRAKYEPRVELMFSKDYSNDSLVQKNPVGNDAGVKTDQFMRSKLAFRDLSNDNTKAGATLIRTRDGK